MRTNKNHKIWRNVFRLLLAVSLILLPTFIAKVKVLRAAEESVVLEVTNISPYRGNDSIAIIDAVVRNEGKVTFNRIEGDLYIFRGDDLLYSCYAAYSGKVGAGEGNKISFTVSNLREAAPLLAYPVREMSYSWIPAKVHFTGFGFMFTQTFDPGPSFPWMIVLWLAMAGGALAAGILARQCRKKEEEDGPAESPAESTSPSSGTYGTGSSVDSAPVGASLFSGTYAAGSSGGYAPSEAYGGSLSHAASAGEGKGPFSTTKEQEPHTAVDRDALESAQKTLEQASRLGASYRTQGQTQNAELQDHFKRTALGNVLEESAGLEGRDRDAFESAKRSYEQASRFEASYRAGGSKENAEHAQYRRESAYGDMLGAIAGKDGRRSSEFDSAKRSYEQASREAAAYRAGGSKENAAEAEHRMRSAYGNMLKNTSDLSRKEAEAYSDAQRHYEYESRQAASYRKQGLTRDAERSEHYMRLEEAKMLKVKAEAKGNSRAFEDARRDYENASRHYYEYKSQGLEADANREKSYMERAYAKMLSNT